VLRDELANILLGNYEAIFLLKVKRGWRSRVAEKKSRSRQQHSLRLEAVHHFLQSKCKAGGKKKHDDGKARHI